MIRRLALAASALAVLAAPAPAVAAKPPRCHLTGTNLAHSRTITVVRRTDDAVQTVKLFGCVRPNGRVRTLAEGVAAETTDTTLSLEAVAGTWVAIRSSSSSQYGGSTALRATDVRTGRSYAIASESYMIAGPYQGHAVAAIAVNARGFTAAVVDDLAGGAGSPVTITQRHVVLFDSRGTPRELDSGPPGELDPGSLILDTRTVLWAHGGLIRYARF